MIGYMYSLDLDNRSNMKTTFLRFHGNIQLLLIKCCIKTTETYSIDLGQHWLKSCRLTALSLYLNQCWIINNNFKWTMDDGSSATATSVINHHNWLEHNLFNLLKRQTSEFLSAALWICGESAKILKHSIWICFIYASRNKSVSISYRFGNIYSCRHVSKQHRHICNYFCEITNWCLQVSRGSRQSAEEWYTTV